MAAYLGQITRIVKSDGYVPHMIEYKLNGKKQVEEWLNDVISQYLGLPDKNGVIWQEKGDFEQRNSIWENDGSYWSVLDYVGGGDWFEIIVVRAIKL